MTAPVTLSADQRIAKGVASSLRWTAVDEWGDEVPAGGAVTVTVTRADGTVVVTGQAAALVDGTVGTYAVQLTASQVGDLDVLTAVWSDGGVEVARTTVEVVGRWFFTVAELRASHPTFQAQSETWTPQLLASYRTLAEHEAEEICGRAFVPRYRRVTLDGPADVVLQLPDADVRAVAAVSVDGTTWTTDQLADVTAYPSGRVELAGGVWPWGRENIVFAYYHGLDVPPPEIRHASMLRAQELAFLGGPNGSAIPRRATSMSTDGTTVQLAQASRLKTGNPDVDAVYDRWSLRTTGSGGSTAGDGGGLAPVSRSVDLNPQYDSLFHGGRR